jgi:hypothetical protein
MDSLASADSNSLNHMTPNLSNVDGLNKGIKNLEGENKFDVFKLISNQK